MINNVFVPYVPNEEATQRRARTEELILQAQLEQLKKEQQQQQQQQPQLARQPRQGFPGFQIPGEVKALADQV